MQCSVCLHRMTNSVKLACDHYFCYPCISCWGNMAQYPLCPLCRAPFSSDDISRRRLTRGMTSRKRHRDCLNQLTSKMYQWRSLKNRGITSETCMDLATFKNVPVLFMLLDEIFRIVYLNKELLENYGCPDASICFRMIIGQKLDTFGEEGYQEAVIWRYKLRHFLDV